MKVEINRKTADKLIEMLNKHYELEQWVKDLVKEFCENADEYQKAVLTAYTFCKTERNNPHEEKSTSKHVIIITPGSFLYFVKAIKESCKIGLKEDKDIADTVYESGAYTPFTIGKNGLFTEEQWQKISDMLKSLGVEYRYLLLLQIKQLSNRVALVRLTVKRPDREWWFKSTLVHKAFR